MLSFKQFAESLSKSELDTIEKSADKKFKSFDVGFSSHFKDRVNDGRNNPEIKSGEVSRIFNKTSKKFDKKLIKEPDGTEGIFVDKDSNINVPFAVNKPGTIKTSKPDLVTKTIMRKLDFKSSSKKYTV